MSIIYVRTVDGRIARSAPKGKFIPSDSFVPVEHTPYIDRLLNFHGDIEEQAQPKSKAKTEFVPPAITDPNK